METNIKKYKHSKHFYYVPWIIVAMIAGFCIFGLFLVMLVGAKVSWPFMFTKYILYMVGFAILSNIVWYFEYPHTYFALHPDKLERHSRWKSWCKEIKYEDIEYIADDALSVFELFKSKNYRYINVFSRNYEDGTCTVIRMIPYDLIGFDEFVRELVKRSTKVKMIAPSLQKYLDTGKIHRTDNADMRKRMLADIKDDKYDYLKPENN